MYQLYIFLALLSVACAKPAQKPFNFYATNDANNLGIIGGHDSDISNQPWQVSIHQDGIFYCGGFLISSRWVLTAGHCIERLSEEDITIRAGSSNNDDGQEVQAVKLIVHPNYNATIVDNDIALIYLSTAVTDSNAKPATLPQDGEEIPDIATLHVSGWGVSLDDDLPELLQAVDIPLVNWQTCVNAYKGLPNIVTQNMFCAGDMKVGGLGACKGDSGGPASINGTVVGIVSWGIDCGNPNYPGVYAKIANFRNWIKEATGI